MNFFMYCYGLNISPPTPQNTYVKITPKVMVLGGGAFGKCLGHEGRYLIYKRGPKICAGDTRNMGSIPGSKKSPGERNGNPVFLPGKFHGQGSLVGCSPWSHKELGTTEQLSARAHSHTHTRTHTQAVQNSSLVTFFLVRIHQEVCNPEEGSRHVCTLIADIQPPEL